MFDLCGFIKALEIVVVTKRELVEVKIKELYFNLEMSAEQIARKLDMPVEEVQAIIDELSCS